MAYGFWGLSFALMMAGTVVGLALDDHVATIVLMTHAIFAAAIGATLTIRGFFGHQNRMIRNAFELGRDSADPVRRVR